MQLSDRQKAMLQKSDETKDVVAFIRRAGRNREKLDMAFKIIGEHMKQTPNNTSLQKTYTIPFFLGLANTRGTETHSFINMTVMRRDYHFYIPKEIDLGNGISYSRELRKLYRIIARTVEDYYEETAEYLKGGYIEITVGSEEQESGTVKKEETILVPEGIKIEGSVMLEKLVDQNDGLCINHGEQSLYYRDGNYLVGSPVRSKEIQCKLMSVDAKDMKEGYTYFFGSIDELGDISKYGKLIATTFFSNVFLFVNFSDSNFVVGGRQLRVLTYTKIAKDQKIYQVVPL